MTEINWQQHVAAFRASKQTIAEYAAATGLKVASLQYYLYKKPKKRRRPEAAFKEFAVASTLAISRDERGMLTLSGIEAKQLPAIIDAWSHALSQ
jgi:hypothetical protein